ncbi:GntR family transcriptional regulator [Alicyclobacillus tolerans]|uniref:FadR/GntR family transcriptional regulator n=1 Tax=Alicyclobacillus tolerans TaxID=90970 RepID=UPI001F02E55A|nr:GntR family transcriptional regulator [Alicyclobacillus tolerans]MCF8563866.1 GntR family transcriptional regulator [Alicyclobacillus tolerans]
MATAEQSDERKLYAQIARRIRSSIENGVFQAGDKLPPLAHLAEEFGCSRATVREALSTLRGQGLVEFRHGDGTYVRSATVEMWMEPLEAAILLSASEASRMVELEISLLAGIAGFAATRADGFDDTRLAQALFALECVIPGSEEAIAAELSFYSILAEIARSSLLENALRVVQEALRSSLRLLRGNELQGVVICRRIAAAVERRDAPGARDSVYQYGEQLMLYLQRKRGAAAVVKMESASQGP